MQYIDSYETDVSITARVERDMLPWLALVVVSPGTDAKQQKFLELPIF